MAEGSVGSVWHKSLANLPSITVDPLFPFISCPQKTDENAVLCPFFLYIHPYVANHLYIKVPILRF